MKSAMSIRAAIFEKAEGLAKWRGISRSESYAMAINEYVKSPQAVGLLNGWMLSMVATANGRGWIRPLRPCRQYRSASLAGRSGSTRSIAGSNGN